MVPDDVMAIIKKMYASYDGKKYFTFDEYYKMVSGDFIQNEAEYYLHGAGGRHHQKRGLTCNEIYKLVLYFKGGKRYRGIRTGARFKGRGIKSSKVVDLGKDERHAIKYITNLHPETRILLYHGTDEKTVNRWVVDGVDLDIPPREEQYPERIIGGKHHGTSYRTGGLYVTIRIGKAFHFGNNVISLVKEARHLTAPNWAIAEAKADGTSVDDIDETRYPNSFRPSVSSYLFLSENQAFLRQSVKPDEILHVFTWRDGKPLPFTRDEWIEKKGIVMTGPGCLKTRRR